jgi:serine/threonine protein kinase
MSAVTQLTLKQEFAANSIVPEADKVDRSDLRKIKVMLPGVPGVPGVAVYQDATNKKYYVVQTLSTANVARNHGGILEEVRMLADCYHQNVVKYHGTYSSRDTVSLITDAGFEGSVGRAYDLGMLFGNMNKTKYVIASLACGLEYLHNRSIINRNIQPDNLAFDSNGHVKIRDFSFAKQLSGDKTYTLCGTAAYQAPETILGMGSGKAVDWWATGIAFVELLRGQGPFFATNQTLMMENIKGKDPNLSGLDQTAQDFAMQLLNKDPNNRYSSVEDLKNDSFFAGFDWDGLEDGSMQSPFFQAIQASIKSGASTANQGDDFSARRLNEPAYEPASKPVASAGLFALLIALVGTIFAVVSYWAKYRGKNLLPFEMREHMEMTKRNREELALDELEGGSRSESKSMLPIGW